MASERALALEAAVKLSHRYIPARQLPDKSVSLLDTACARVAVSLHATPAEVDDSRKRIEALNYALRNIPEDRVRHHTCYGINIGPRIHEMELKDMVDLILKIRAGAYSFEAANPRHAHEWKVFETVKLPEGKILLPGVVGHVSNVVEHPELVAWRIELYAQRLGRENVIASTDCGYSQGWNIPRVHPQVQWAKLKALGEGARLASAKL